MAAKVAPEEARLRDELLSDADDLLGWLASSFALAEDVQLQAEVRRRAGVEASAPLMVALPETGAWIHLDGDGAAAVRRDPIPGLRQQRFQVEGPEHAPLRQALAAAIQRSDATAWAVKLLTPIFDVAGSPARAEIAALLEWSPVLERIAYRYYAKTIALLDRVRPRVIAAIAAGRAGSDPDALAYWSGLHVASHLCLIAAGAEARPWLSAIAAQSDWTAWTPSLPLVRERTLWLAAVAAKSASAFGEAATPIYLSALDQADHPLKVFDALMGLMAIALADADAADEVVTAIRKHRPILAGPAYAAQAEAMACAALATIEQVAVERGRPLPDAEFLNEFSVRWDPMSAFRSGRPLGFSALPALVRTDVALWYPPARRVDLRLSPADLPATLARAWIAEETPTPAKSIN